MYSARIWKFQSFLPRIYYILEYGEAFAIGKLYSNGVRRFEGYDASLDDLVETNLVMVARKQPQLIELLTLTSDVHL